MQTIRLMTTRALYWKWAARFERGVWRFPTAWHHKQFETEKQIRDMIRCRKLLKN